MKATCESSREPPPSLAAACELVGGSGIQLVRVTIFFIGILQSQGLAREVEDVDDKEDEK